MSAGSETNEESDEEWRFSLDEIATREEDSDESVPEDEDTDGNVAGTLERNQPLEPGNIALENAIFVTIGALLVIGLIAAAFLGI